MAVYHHFFSRNYIKVEVCSSKPDKLKAPTESVTRTCSLTNLNDLQCKEADNSQQVCVCASANSHLELMKTAPNFAELDALLQVLSEVKQWSSPGCIISCNIGKSRRTSCITFFSGGP